MNRLDTTNCARCGSPLGFRSLICAQCGLLTHVTQLQQIAEQAMARESVDPVAAGEIWSQALAYLPVESPEHMAVRQRISALGGQPTVRIGVGEEDSASLDEEDLDAAPPQPMVVSFAKTFASMLVSAAVYRYLFNLPWVASLGFVVLMLVHEMGHVFAIWHYRMRASPPIFVPFLGAMINLRQEPPNAKVEAIIGIGGPLLGTIGACAAFLFSFHSAKFGIDPRQVLLAAHFAFQLNLFNLLPVPPLDGGRITAAVSPWLWMIGLVGLVTLGAAIWLMTGQVPVLLFMVLFFAMPRVLGVFKGINRNSPYYAISWRSRFVIGLLYALLLASLFYLTLHSYMDVR